MEREDQRYATDWMRVAEKDWTRVSRALGDGDAEEAGFWLQQSTERYLKAYLLSKGWALRRVHDLEVLVNEAAEYQRDLRRYEIACRNISGYYLAVRYPFIDGLALTAEDVLGAREEIEPLVDCIRRELS